MNNKLYKLMNWPEIEEIVYSDGCDPHRILGAHKVGGNILIQAFRPDAESLAVITGQGKRYEMELADEAGFYAVLIPKQKDVQDYVFEMTDKDGTVKRFKDPYCFSPVLAREDAIKLVSGVHYSVQERLGAHPVKKDGINGIYFAVWAPFVARVSVVGAFNAYDGRIHQMRQIDPCGIFEIFIPELSGDITYQYEIKTKEGLLFLKPDPYTIQFAGNEENESAIASLPDFEWTDDAWIKKRKKNVKTSPRLSVCEICLEQFMAEYGEDNTCETIAPVLVSWLKDNGFNAVEFMPVMKHLPEDPYAVTGFFAVHEALGTAENLMALVDTLHKADICVIMDFPATFFAEQNITLRQYTGNALYEYGDSRGLRPGSGYIVFDYGRKEVQNYLIACALFWITNFHPDGLRLPDISKILYLDYDRAPGEWTPNIYGSNENLEAEAFVRALNSTVFKKDPALVMITKETACYPQVTGALAEGGLGFDYKWNNGWSRDFLSYMSNDPIFRAPHHNELTFSLIYHYSERFILAFSHEDISGLRELYDMMPGDDFSKAANTRFALAYLFLHPGRKMVYRGIFDIPEERGRMLTAFLRDLNDMYALHPALYASDDIPEGFTWINSISAEACYMAFLREDTASKERLLVVCNMAGIEQTLTVGVPEDGKYYEIMNTDLAAYGGSLAALQEDPKEPARTECDGRDYMLEVRLGALSVAVYQYIPFTEEENEIRRIRHESQDMMEEERVKTRDSMEEKLRIEEEKLLQELREKYEKEILMQENAIREKYHRQEEIKIQNILSGASDEKKLKKIRKKKTEN